VITDRSRSIRHAVAFATLVLCFAWAMPAAAQAPSPPGLTPQEMQIYHPFRAWISIIG
jgi:hypothetical protein